MGNRTSSLPSLRAQWSRWLSAAPQDLARELAPVLTRYWPAPHAGHLREALSFAVDDGVIDAVRVEPLMAAVALEAGDSPSLVDYAVFAAYRHISKNAPNPSRAAMGRQWLSAILDQHDPEGFDAAVAYGHMLSLRRVVVAWMHRDSLSVGSGLDEWLEIDGLAVSDTDQRLVRALCSGELLFAQRQKRAPELGRRPTGRIERGQQTHAARTQSQAQQRPGPLNRAHVDGTPESLNVRPAAHRRAGENIRAVDTPAMERLNGLDARAPAPLRFHMALRARQAISVQSMPSLIEAAILSPEQIRWAMAQLDTPIQRAAVAMLLQGWSITAVEALRVGDPTDDNENAPFLNRLTGELCYRIRTPGQTSAQCEVALTLSPTLVRLLGHGASAPFTGCGKQLDRRWQSRGHSQPGLTVTCQRMTRSGRRTLWGLCEGGWDLAAISGEANLAQSVSLTYRRIAPEQIQCLYNRWCAHWGLDTPTPPTIAPPPVGSTRALSLPEFATIQRQLFQRSVLAARRGSDAALIESLNSVTAYLVGALALVCGLRSLGPGTEWVIQGERLWVREKNSKNRSESRTVSLPRSLGEALAHWRDRVESVLHGHNVSVAPPWQPFVYRNAKNDLAVEAFRLSHWRDRVAEVCDTPVATNALRHTLASASQQRIPYPLIHWLMGHHRELDAPVHPSANVAPAFNTMRAHQHQLLRDIDFDPGIVDVLRTQERA